MVIKSPNISASMLKRQKLNPADRIQKFLLTIALCYIVKLPVHVSEGKHPMQVKTKVTLALVKRKKKILLYSYCYLKLQT